MDLKKLYKMKIIQRLIFETSTGIKTKKEDQEKKINKQEEEFEMVLKKKIVGD